MELRGADVTLSFSRLEDEATGPDGRVTFAKTSLQGSTEFGFGLGFGAQFDGSFFEQNASSRSFDAAGLHLFRQIGAGVSLGAYYTDGDLGRTFGFEAAGDISGVDSEAYLGRILVRNGDGTMLGISGGDDLRPDLQMVASLERLNLGGGSVTSLGLGLDYHVSQRVTLFAEVGGWM